MILGLQLYGPIDWGKMELTEMFQGLKKLGKHRWPWPENKESVNEINSSQMAMLLTGIDFTQMHEELHFEKFAWYNKIIKQTGSDLNIPLL